jgi:predicted ester cyclase
MGAAENKQRTIRTIEIFNSGDADGYLANYAEDALVHGLPPDFEPTRDGLRRFIGVTLNALPDLQFLIEDVIAEDDRVAVRGRFAATQRGELLGAAPTGDHLEWEMTTILRFGADGRILERWIQDDTLALLVQLGLVQSVVVPA